MAWFIGCLAGLVNQLHHPRGGLGGNNQLSAGWAKWGGGLESSQRRKRDNRQHHRVKAAGGHSRATNQNRSNYGSQGGGNINGAG